MFVSEERGVGADIAGVPTPLHSLPLSSLGRCLREGAGERGSRDAGGRDGGPMIIFRFLAHLKRAGSGHTPPCVRTVPAHPAVPSQTRRA